MGRRRSPVKQTNRHVQELVVVSGHFFTESRIYMAKKKRVKSVKRKAKSTSKRILKSSRKGGKKSRSASGKSKDSKVAKLIKLAKMRTKSKGKKAVSKVVKKKRR